MGILNTERLRLRPLEKSDAPNLVQWMNDVDVTRYLSHYLPMTLEEEEIWIAERHKKYPHHIVWGIEMRETSRLIGTVGLHLIDHRSGIATLGISIGEKTEWGKGYGTEAVERVVAFAFEVLNLRKVTLEVYGSNGRAQACYKKCGFRKEGCLKKHRFARGRYEDMVVMSVFRPCSPR